MKVLILGGSGMLGHKAWQVLRNDLNVFLTIRGDFSEIQKFNIFDKEKTIPHVDVLEFPILQKAIVDLDPDVILNCIGIVKQKEEAKDFIQSIEVNSLFPHKLAKLCDNINARLIHISTDCVFSGRKGNYTEQDYPDPLDLYGRTKLLGEVTAGRALTLRTSIIGQELQTQHGLVEWFLHQQGKTVKGYAKAIYSGFPTIVFCNILKDVIMKYNNLRGLYHVASEPIDKYSLLCLIRSIYKLDIEVGKYDEIICDRSLNCSTFKKVTNFKPPSWERMIKIMREDSKIYNRRLSENEGDFK